MAQVVTRAQFVKAVNKAIAEAAKKDEKKVWKSLLTEIVVWRKIAADTIKAHKRAKGKPSEAALWNSVQESGKILQDLELAKTEIEGATARIVMDAAIKEGLSFEEHATEGYGLGFDPVTITVVVSSVVVLAAVAILFSSHSPTNALAVAGEVNVRGRAKYGEILDDPHSSPQAKAAAQKAINDLDRMYLGAAVQADQWIMNGGGSLGSMGALGTLVGWLPYVATGWVAWQLYNFGRSTWFEYKTEKLQAKATQAASRARLLEAEQSVVEAEAKMAAAASREAAGGESRGTPAPGPVLETRPVTPAPTQDAYHGVDPAVEAILRRRGIR